MGIGRGPLEIVLSELKQACDGEWKVFEPNRPGLFEEVHEDGMICLVVDVDGGYTRGGRTNSWRVLRFKDVEDVE